MLKGKKKIEHGSIYSYVDIVPSVDQEHNLKNFLFLDNGNPS